MLPPSTTLLILHIISFVTMSHVINMDILITDSKKHPSNPQQTSTNTPPNNLFITLYWNFDIYECVITPNGTNKHYYCNKENTILQTQDRKVLKKTGKYSISLEYNAPGKLLIDEIKSLIHHPILIIQ